MSQSLEPSKSSWVPHDYQKTAITLLLGQAGAALFLDPGLGKTSISLATFLILKRMGLARKMLVVCPRLPMMNSWPGEIEKWSEFNHLTYTILHGKNKHANLQLDADIYLINPEGMLWLWERTEFPEWDILVVDESSKFKHTGTRRFQHLRKNLDRFARRWILTGTPVPNGLLDLFGQLFIIDYGAALGQYITHYKSKYFTPEHFGSFNYIPLPGAFEEIVEKIRPYAYQLSAEDVLAMPELMFVERTIKLPEHLKKMYKEIEDEFFTELADGSELAFANAAVVGTKCRQLANGWLYSGEGKDRTVLPFHEEKLDALEDLVEELDGHSLLILYEYTHDRERIRERLGRISGPDSVRFLGSGCSAKYVEESISLFNAGKVRYLLGHPESMGYGLNLQGDCNHVIWFGPPWRLDFWDQSIARVYRQGQRKGTVFVYSIVAKDTRDERAREGLTGKDRTQAGLLKALATR